MESDVIGSAGSMAGRHRCESGLVEKYGGTHGRLGSEGGGEVAGEAVPEVEGHGGQLIVGVGSHRKQRLHRLHRLLSACAPHTPVSHLVSYTFSSQLGIFRHVTVIMRVSTQHDTTHHTSQ